MALTSGDILVYDGSQWNNQPSTSNAINIDSGTFYLDSTNDRVGIGTTTPAAKLHLLHTAEQLRLGYDGTHYTTFTVDSGGALTIGNNPSTANISISPQANLNLGTGLTDGIFLGRTDTVIKTTVQGRLLVDGSFSTGTAPKSASYPLTDTDSVIFANAASAAITITLPAASANTVGRVYYVFKVDGTGNAVSMAASGSDTLNGIATSTTTQWQCLRIVGYTTTAWIVSRF